MFLAEMFNLYSFLFQNKGKVTLNYSVTQEMSSLLNIFLQMFAEIFYEILFMMTL